ERVHRAMRLHLESHTRRAHVAAGDCSVEPRAPELEAAGTEERVEAVVRAVVGRVVATRVVVLEYQTRCPWNIEPKAARCMQREGKVVEVGGIRRGCAGARPAELTHDLELKVELPRRQQPPRANARRAKLPIRRPGAAAVALVPADHGRLDRARCCQPPAPEGPG